MDWIFLAAVGLVGYLAILIGICRLERALETLAGALETFNETLRRLSVSEEAVQKSWMDYLKDPSES
jgi:hypothetical protein